ncbi:hypothetical protein MRX96_000040, partial [Rhipicephalus microplus]
GAAKNRVSRGGAKNRVCRGGAKTASAGAARKLRQPGRKKKKTRLPGRARVRHHRENCGKQTWRSSEWAASQAQPKSAKSELRQPGRQKPRQPGRRENRVCRGGTKPRQPGRRENCVSRGEPGCGTTGKTVANRHGDRVSGPPARHSRKSAKSELRQPGRQKPRQPGRRKKPRLPGRHETASAGAARKLRQPGQKEKKTRLPGRARVRHHRENCGKQTWRSSEWAASQAQPKSAKSELRQPGRQKPRQPGRRKNRVCRGGTKPRQPGRRENCVSRGEPGCGTTGKTVANRHGDRVSGPPARHSRKSAKSELRQPGRQKTASAGAAQKTASAGAARNRVSRGGAKTASAGAKEKKTRLPGRARVRHHRENCGKQTWRSSEWAASQAQPKSAKSELRLPGRHETASAGAARKPRLPGRRENCVSRGERKKTRLPGRARVRHHRENCGKQTWRSSEWAASQAQPKSAKSELRLPGRHETASAGAARKPRLPGRHETASAWGGAKTASAGASPGAAPPGKLWQTDMAIE